MVMKYYRILAICFISFLTFFSGITRHDVKEEKYLKLGRQKQFDCVGQVYSDSAVIGGSCVLISDRFILSAAHVFMVSDMRQDTIQMNGLTIIANQPYNIRVTDVNYLYVHFNGQKIKAKRIIIHPNYLDSLTKGSCDIALVELEQPVKMVSPAKLNSQFDELTSEVVGVGYGASGPADRPDLVAQYNKKIAGENTVDSLAGTKYGGHETFLMCDFDHPSQKGFNKMGSAVPRPLEYVCSGGDSGGGLFRQKENQWELIGICSSGNSGLTIDQIMKTGYYGAIMQWTRVSVFVNWIASETK